MKVAFFGTPEFAIPSLQKLASSPHKLVGAVTAPDKPRGRGREVIPTPIALEAEKSGLPVLKPEDLNDDDFQASLGAWEADVFAVVAFRILPESVYEMPEFGSINLHASLLPAYRGAAPIQWALWKGEKETGATTFRIVREVDTGNILKQRRVEILDKDNAGSLSERLADIGAELLLETITELEQGKLIPQRQDAGLATRAPKITREHCLIDWNRTAIEIHNQVRALSPHPSAFTYLDGQMVKIFHTEVAQEQPKIEAGKLRIDDQGMTAGTGRSDLRILELQLQGKKRMEVTTFLRGFRPRGMFKLCGEEE